MVSKRKNPLELEVTTETDTYRVKVPTGDIGWIHFSILMEAENEKANALEEYRRKWNEETGTYDEEKVRLPSPREAEIMRVAMQKWIKEVMPHVIVSHQWDEVPWFDIMPIFQAISTNSSINTTNFRPVQES